MRRLFGAIAGAVLLLWAGAADAAEAPAAGPQMSGWFERTIGQLEAEAVSDVSMAPDVWSALGRAGSAGSDLERDKKCNQQPHASGLLNLRRHQSIAC